MRCEHVSRHVTLSVYIYITIRGVHPDYFVKLDFEIAVDQQTRARDRTFEVVPHSGLRVPAGQPRPYLVNLWPNFG